MRTKQDQTYLEEKMGNKLIVNKMEKVSSSSKLKFRFVYIWITAPDST